MRPLRTAPRSLSGEHGYTLIELVVAMALGLVVSLAAFAFLQFSTSSVSRITERVHVDQTGRTALERMVLRLHSACVSPGVAPIQVKSNETTIKFLSEGGTESAFAHVHMHEITYTPPSGETKGKLTESIYASTSEPPEYKFEKTAQSTTTLLTGVKQSTFEGASIPVFRYYRYYHTGDTPPAEHATVPLGELNPKALSKAEMENEKETKDVAKVTIAFTLAPEGKETATFNHDRPVPLEDSIVFRVAPSSETAINLPCSPET
jgi:prepilin-type N-terminal cleavage/methylation domain-containing protein